MSALLPRCITLDPRPAIFQSDRTVEYQVTLTAGVPVGTEVADPLELETRLGLSLGQARLGEGVAHFERIGVEVLKEIGILVPVRLFDLKQVVIEAYFHRYRMRGADPVNHTLHLAPLGV